MTLISSNQALLDEFKTSGGYDIIPTTVDPLNTITVDLVLQELFEEEELSEQDSDEESGGDDSESATDDDED